MPKSGLHIPSLDGLRAISFSIVFVAHAGLDSLVPGGFGVTVFFFLSGFLITTLMRIEFDETGRVSLKNFYLRRILRIFPPFYVVLLSASALAALGVLNEKVRLAPFLAQVLHATNYWQVVYGYGSTVRGSGVYWSLAVEEHFYLLFPLLYLTLRRRRLTPAGQAKVLGGLCLAVLLWRCVLVYALHASTDRTYLASDTRVDSILFGCLLAVYGNPVLDRSPVSDRVWKVVLLPLALAALVFTFLFRSVTFRETFRYSLQGVALVPVFVCAIRFPRWGAMKLLNLRPVAFVGVLSYSLYLLHHVILFGIREHLQPPFGPLSGAIAALALALVLAQLIHVTIERPCARLRRRLSV